LKQIGQPRLALFFSKFATDLQAAKIVLPEFCPSNDEYYVALAALLASPGFPAGPKETLARLEFLAAPENAAHLESAITQHISHISLHHTQPAVDRALELWFHNPDAVTDLFVSLRPDLNGHQVLHESQSRPETAEEPEQRLKLRNLKWTAVEPWPEPVNLKTLLDAIVQVLKRFVVLPKWAAETLALWVVHTYCFHLRDISTYIGLESPEARCGKTTLLTVLNELSYRALASSNVSPPAFFHVIEDFCPTLLIDEADTFLHRNDQLKGILNAGYTRKTAFVLRVGNALNEEENSEPSAPAGTVNRFSCWCPKIIAQIGRLPATLADRCILIRMQRKAYQEKCDRLRKLDVADLRRQCLRFARDHAQAITDADPNLPESLSDRAADIWEPLFVLADLAGPEWSATSRDAAISLAAASYDSNPITSLLTDICIEFYEPETDRLFSRDLVAELNRIPNRPWAEVLRGKPVTELWLSQQLRRYGIRPRNIVINGIQAKGYLLSDCRDIFSRYMTRADLHQRSGVPDDDSPSPANPETPKE
jgi:hypothetical protein